MVLSERIRSFEILGDRLRRYHELSNEMEIQPLVRAAGMAFSSNPWFTPEHIRIALNNLGRSLTAENLDKWLAPYIDNLDALKNSRKVGVVMAGNIPAVGFHDFLCVLISGHTLIAKLSSSDNHLLPAMAEIMIEHHSGWKDKIFFTTGRLEQFDAIIATGSSNTSRYFEHYFGRHPHIIRKTRHSIAVLNGDESSGELENLSDDIMLYFGMGCRSISKIHVPAGYDFTALVKALSKYDDFINHNKYFNNYQYNKSIFMVGQVPFIDTGFLLLKEDVELASRIALLNYEFYSTPEEIDESVKRYGDTLQCAVSKMPLSIKSLRPGEGQNPALWDYADHIDTLEFLLS
ncbi:MAG: hypothetical protein ACOYNC_14490 [Bacteroidales bacterium]